MEASYLSLKPGNQSEYSDKFDDDDWLFHSVKTYDELHMYELSNPTPVIEWTTDYSIFIACHLPNKRSELLQLSLPSSLLPKSQEICKEHDFCVLNGGFRDQYVVAIRQVPGSSLLVTAESDRNCISLSRLPTDSDSGIIENFGEVLNRRPTSQPAVIDTHASTIVFGDQTDNVCAVDVPTNLITFSSSTTLSTPHENLSRLFFVDEHCIVGCSRSSGSVNLWDLRDCSAGVRSFRGQTRCGSGSETWASQKLNNNTLEILQMSSKGSVILSDIRNMKSDIVETTIELSFHEPLDQHMTLGVSSSNDSFSASGCDGNVYVYKLPVSSTPRLQPNFVHTGHINESSNKSDLVVLTAHWHPGALRNTIMSAASDGSLHAWQFIAPGIE